MSVTLEYDDDTIHGLDPDGRPDPGYARSLGLVAAPAARRSLAFTIDTAAVLLVSLPITLGTLPLWLATVDASSLGAPASLLRSADFVAGLVLYAIGQGLVSILLLVQLLLHGLRGATLGKAATGIRSVNVAGFTRPGFWRVVLRALVLWLALAVIPVIGAIPFLLSPLWDRERRGRGWLDRLGRNWLVDTRHGLNPLDAKALRHARKQATSAPPPATTPLPSLSTSTNGAVSPFVPRDRSSSGVIGVRPHDTDDAREPWSPPARIEPPEPREVAAPAVPIAMLILDDGRRVAIDRDGVFGRDPQIADEGEHRQLLELPDDTSQLSKTHGEFGLDADGFWLRDRGSVNGTLVAAPGEAAVPLVPWERTHIRRGSRIEVGARSFTVEDDARNTGESA